MFSSRKHTDCVTTSTWRCLGSKLGYSNSSISKYPSQFFVISTLLSPLLGGMLLKRSAGEAFHYGLLGEDIII